MTARTDLRITQGVDLTLQWAWTAGGQRQSLDGWAAHAQIRDEPGGCLLLDLTPHLSVVPNVTVNGVSGDAVQLRLSAEQTRRVSSGGAWDLFLIDADGGQAVRAVKLVQGQVSIRRAVTVVTGTGV